MPQRRESVVLIPIRSFDDAKSRLADVLSVDDRRDLAVAMAEIVVRAGGDLPVWVVTDDDEVAEWARSAGTEPLAVGRPGLTDSVTTAVRVASIQGFDRAIIAHADLPFADDVTVVDGPGLAIAPDRRRDGSNVMSVPTDAGFGFAYGPGSFRAHIAEAERLGLRVDVINAPDLAWDVDDPGDLPDGWRNMIGTTPPGRRIPTRATEVEPDGPRPPRPPSLEADQSAS